ncbi:MAG: hypothetical protein ACRD3G_12750 [Vicinamibacterales bacterium]
MNTDIISARSEESGRTAVVHEEIDSVWLYLSRPGETRPEVACWVLNTSDAPPVPDFATYRGPSAPPPLPIAHVEGAPPDPRHGRWSLLWSRDGHAVAALLDDRPIAFIVAGQSRGYARYVKAGANPWALPWDEGSFAAAFGHL